MARHIAVVLCVLFSPHHVAYPAGSSEYVDELRFVELQLSAVTTDMYRYLGWVFEDKAAMKEAAQKAQADLGELKIRLAAVRPSAEGAKLQGVLLDMVDRLEGIYRGIETKPVDAVKQEFAPLNDLHEQYAQLLKAAWSEPEVQGDSVQAGDSLDEELRWLEHPEDQDAYRKAASLIEAGRMAEAYKMFKGLEHTVEDPHAAHLIWLRTSDALHMMNAEQAAEAGFANAFDASELALDLLTPIVESEVYSPVLYEAFYKWRTTTQEFHHGMSNFSEIPNKAYNDTRWRVIQTVKKHLTEHPGDVWARKQLGLLWELPNIQRGGPFGNDNLIHWATLYKALESEDESEE